MASMDMAIFADGASRREFLKGSAWMGLAAMAAGCANNPLKFFGTEGAPMQGFALKPMKEVRVACIGVGTRGAEAVPRIASIPGTRTDAEVCRASFHSGSRQDVFLFQNQRDPRV